MTLVADCGASDDCVGAPEEVQRCKEQVQRRCSRCRVQRWCTAGADAEADVQRCTGVVEVQIWRRS